MAHDKQVPQELPEELREPNSDSTPLKPQALESLAALDDWWTLYGQIYRDDPTDALAMVFRDTLKHFPADILRQACMKAQIQAARLSLEGKRHELRPTPGMVHAIAESLMLRREQAPGQNRPKYLDAPKLSEAERQAELQSPEYLAQREKLTGKAKGAA